MDKINNLIILYDYYQALLTDKQCKYFEQYYFDNLSLSEMSDNLQISRNAIHKVLKNVESKLIDYELKLKLYEKGQKLENLMLNIQDENIINKLKELL